MQGPTSPVHRLGALFLSVAGAGAGGTWRNLLILIPKPCIRYLHP